MCIIIVKPAGEKLLKTIYEESYWNNRDGFGISYCLNGELVTKKGTWNLKRIMEEIEPVEDLALVLHYRVASPGMIVNEENCHPFVVSSEEMIDVPAPDQPPHLPGEPEPEPIFVQVPRYTFSISHNGKLAYYNTDKKSDTMCFVDTVLGNVLAEYPRFLDDPWGKFIMQAAIGSLNKMAIMRYDKKENSYSIIILNERGGFADKEAHFVGKIWYSNKSYLKRSYVQSTMTGKDAWHQQREFTGYLAPVTKPNNMYNFSPTCKSEEPGWQKSAAKIDHNGWRWDFQTNLWVNVLRDAQLATLTYRMWPEYMRTSIGEIKWAEHERLVTMVNKAMDKTGYKGVGSSDERGPLQNVALEIITKHSAAMEVLNARKWYEEENYEKRQDMLNVLCTNRKWGATKHDRDRHDPAALPCTCLSVPHLNNNEKGILCKAAKKLHFMLDPGFTWDLLTTPEKLTWFRVEVCDIMECPVSDNDGVYAEEDMDTYLLEEIKAGRSPWAEVLEQQMIEQEKKQAKDDEEAAARFREEKEAPKSPPVVVLPPLANDEVNKALDESSSNEPTIGEIMMGLESGKDKPENYCE